VAYNQKLCAAALSATLPSYDGLSLPNFMVHCKQQIPEAASVSIQVFSIATNAIICVSNKQANSAGFVDSIFRRPHLLLKVS
jgi:hypothetical protein